MIVGLAAAGAYVATRHTPVPITLSDATLLPLPDGTAALFVTIDNPGPPDTLRDVTSGQALMGHMMGATGPLAIPGGGRALLAADGAHAMLMGVEGPLDEGRLIAVTLNFAQGGAVSTRARVTAPPDPDNDPHAGHGAAPAGSGGGATLSVLPEGVGWRVTIEAPGFTFVEAPEGAVDVPGEGHGHLYLNGLKLQRMYAPSALIGALPPGEHAVTVSLNNHSHAPFAVDGAPVVARARIVQR